MDSRDNWSVIAYEYLVLTFHKSVVFLFGPAACGLSLALRHSRALLVSLAGLRGVGVSAVVFETRVRVWTLRTEIKV